MISFVTVTSTGTVTFYTNGELNKAAQEAGAMVAGTTNLIIGNNNAENSTFDGLINGVRIYDGILTAQEISQVYSSEKERYVK